MYYREAGAEVTTLRAGFDPARLEEFRPDLVVLSPGPGRPSDFGCDELLTALDERGIAAFGVEAQRILRLEKGHFIVGQDTDGTVTPDDAGLSWAIGRNKADFVGKRSLQRPALQSPDRRQLVGLLTTDPQLVLEEGSQVLGQAENAAPVRPLGHVTSSYYSATLDRSIAMALALGVLVVLFFAVTLVKGPAVLNRPL